MTFFGRPLRVRRDINPLHLWRPIDSAQWTTIDTGKVSLCKDNGRGTARDLEQATPADRFTHGTDSRGNQFMQDTVGDKFMAVTSSVVADWTFMHNGLQPITIACIVEIDAQSTMNNIMRTFGASALNGFNSRINGLVGTAVAVAASVGGGNGAVEMLEEDNGPNGIYVFVARWRDGDNTSVITPHANNKIDAELRSQGTNLSVNQPRQSAYNTGAPEFILRLGETADATVNGIIGKFYEWIIDDRWWSDSILHGYEQRAVAEFGAAKMIL